MVRSHSKGKSLVHVSSDNEFELSADDDDVLASLIPRTRLRGKTVAAADPPNVKRKSVKGKTTRKKITSKAQEKNPAKKAVVKGTKAQKCTINYARTLVAKYKDRIPQECWDILLATPFGRMLECFKDGLLTEDACMKQELDLFVIMKHYSKGRMAWFFGDEKAEITKVDIVALFGLPCDGGRVLTYKTVEPSELAGRLFSSVADPTGPSRKEILDRIIMRLPRRTSDQIAGDVDSEDAVEKLFRNRRRITNDNPTLASLVVLHLLASFFICNNKGNIGWCYVNAALDLHNLNQIDWCETILESLFAGLCINDPGSPKAFNGCTILILYWFLERTRLQRPLMGPLYHDRPRFARWSINKLFAREDLDHNSMRAVNLYLDGPWTDEMLDGDDMPKARMVKEAGRQIRIEMKKLKDIVVSMWCDYSGEQTARMTSLVNDHDLGLFEIEKIMSTLEAECDVNAARFVSSPPCGGNSGQEATHASSPKMLGAPPTLAACGGDSDVNISEGTCVVDHRASDDAPRVSADEVVLGGADVSIGGAGEKNNAYGTFGMDNQVNISKDTPVVDPRPSDDASGVSADNVLLGPADVSTGGAGEKIIGDETSAMDVDPIIRSVVVESVSGRGALA